MHKFLLLFIIAGAMFVANSLAHPVKAAKLGSKGCVFSPVTEIFNIGTESDGAFGLVVPVGQRVTVDAQIHSCAFGKSIIDVRWYDSTGKMHHKRIRAGSPHWEIITFMNDAETERIEIYLFLEKGNMGISFNGWVISH